MLARRRTAVLTSWLGGLAVVAWVAYALGALLVRGGLHPCDRLDARLCRDLGAADCAIWTTRLHRVGAASSEPHRFRGNRTALVDLALHRALGWDARRADNPLCYDELTDGIYPPILAAVRQSVTAARSVPDAP